MKACVPKRLSWIELVLEARRDDPAVAIDLSVFSDDELDRLEWFAIQRSARIGDDGIDAGLSSAERKELDALLAKASGLSD